MDQEDKILVKRISLNSQELTQIDENLLAHLKKTIERRCDTCGFITKIYEIKSRSKGITDTNSFSGEVNYDVWFQANVVRVGDGDILLGCTITLIAAPGIFLEKNGIVKIFINSKYLPPDFMKKFKVNQTLNIYVMKSSCELSNTQIDVLGRIHYYAEVPLVDRLVVLGGQSNTEVSISLNTRDDKETIENLCELGYIPKIEEAKAEIDEIPGDIWKFYRSLLNPLELVWSPSRYSTFKIPPKNPKVPVPSRAYYKLWEIINRFEVVNNTKSSPITIANLCEAPGGFVKAIIDYREARGLGKKDRYTVVSIKGQDTIQFSKDLLKAYKSQITVNPMNCDCDLTKIVTVQGCVKAFGADKADVVTADGGIRTAELDFEEEKETGLLKTSELITALSIQKTGGSLVWKLFDTCTRLSADLLWLIKQYYEEVNLYKPETSRPANSERYVVATGFKGINRDEMSALHKIIEDSKKYIVSFVSEEVRNSDDYQNFVRELKVFNGRLMTNQYKKIKEIINFIKFKNVKMLSGAELAEYQSRQKIIATNWAKQNDLAP